jgi:transcriptional regulator with XRE-family HTH domain
MTAYPFDVVLHPLLLTAKIPSWQQLANTSGISVSRLRQLRRGQIATWKISELQKLSLALQIPLASLLEKLEIINILDESQPTDFQYTSFQIIESFLTYWPAAAHQAKLDPTFPASKLLPLVGSIDRLIASWGIASIGQVGEIIPFNPQLHQSIESHISPTTPVQIRYPGYQQGDRLLTRAKVSPSHQQTPVQ